MPHTISYNIYIYEPLRKVDTINKTQINCVKLLFFYYCEYLFLGPFNLISKYFEYLCQFLILPQKYQ